MRLLQRLLLCHTEIEITLDNTSRRDFRPALISKIAAALDSFDN